MSNCQHPRSVGYTDHLGRSRCGACNDVWVEDAFIIDDKPYGGFVPIDDNDQPVYTPIVQTRF